MSGSRVIERKLKLNLGLVVKRMQLQEKKKTSMGQRERPEIAEYCRIGKPDRARVRVESIIRDDYLVEAMELIEMHADLLLTRVGLLQAGNLHESLRKPVATLIWSAPRLVQFCPELQVVHNLLERMYGRKFVKACESNEMDYVCERVIAKLDPKPPKPALVERYLIEICKSADVDFTPDAKALAQDLFDNPPPGIDLIEFNNNFQGPPGGPGAPPSGPGGAPGGFGGGSRGGGSGGGGSTDPVFSYAAPAIPPNPSTTNVTPQQPSLPVYNNDSAKVEPGPGVEEKQVPPLPSKSSTGALQPPTNQLTPYPSPYSGPQNTATEPQMPILPDFPSVPPNLLVVGSSSNQNTSGDVDFDDLSRRFQNLRKKT